MKAHIRTRSRTAVPLCAIEDEAAVVRDFADDLSGSAEELSVALVDERRLVRDCIGALLRRFAPDISVASYATADEIDLPELSLAVIWIERGGAEGLGQTIEKVEGIRKRYARTPIAAFVAREDPDLVRCAMNLGLNLIEQKTSTRNIALASIRLALAGGSFTSLDLLQDQIFGLQPDSHRGADKRSAQTSLGPPAPDFCRLPNFDPRYAEQWAKARLVSKLTAREMDILHRLDRGLQNKVIAFELGISCCTVKVHIRNIMKKLNATNRTQVAFLCRQFSFGPVAPPAESPRSPEHLARKLDS